MIEGLPELTPDERAAMESITQDFIDRIIQGIDLHEKEAQRIDGMAGWYAAENALSKEAADAPGT